MAAPAPTTMRIGDLLIREGLITKEQLDQALLEQKQNGTRIGYNLVKLGFVPEIELTKTLAKQFKMPAVDLSKFAVEDLKFITRYDIFPVIAGEFTIRTQLEKIFESTEAALGNILKSIETADEAEIEVVEEKEEEMSAAALAAAVDDAPVVKLLNGILTDAVKRGASDIHFECFEHELRVRYRIDGALQEIMKPPVKMKAALISRFKIMSALNIAERRVPQDGRIKLKVGQKVIDFRVSTCPTIFGEKVVLRILDKGNLTLDLEKFGIEKQAEKDLMEAVQNPYGMVLVTGPTGSGKTTTLYSCIAKVNDIDTNIMTAEDPVEYNMYGVNQVLVRNEVGMTFAAALKAFLRQDPNIIMVGEIRDLETGGIAIKAALTGHLVLSTLHTNSAPETVTRLLDMGLEPFNVASALNLILAQRLLRRICGNCKEKVELTKEEYEAAKVTPETKLKELRFTQAQLEAAKERATPEAVPYLKDLTVESPMKLVPIFKGKGCEKCGGSGLKGRQGVYEVMAMTPAVRKVVMQNAGATEIKDTAVDNGMLTLRMDAWMKVMKGITTFEQMIRETSA
jgi:type IV pilus assembly protein PilB